MAVCIDIVGVRSSMEQNVKSMLFSYSIIIITIIIIVVIILIITIIIITIVFIIVVCVVPVDIRPCWTVGMVNHSRGLLLQS